MDKLRIMVLCSHPLLGSGIVRLLSRDPGLEVVNASACSADGHGGFAVAVDADAIVVEVDDRAAEAERVVQALPPVTVVVVTLADNGMEVYRDRKRVAIQGDGFVDLVSRALVAAPAARGESVP